MIILLWRLRFLFLVQLQARFSRAKIAAETLIFLTMPLDSIAFCSPVKVAEAGQVSLSGLVHKLLTWQQKKCN
jgi:hypothetical protein